VGASLPAMANPPRQPSAGSARRFGDRDTAPAPSHRAAWLARTSRRIVLFRLIISGFLLTRHLVTAPKGKKQTAQRERESKHTSSSRSLSSRPPPRSSWGSPGAGHPGGMLRPPTQAGERSGEGDSEPARTRSLPTPQILSRHEDKRVPKRVI